jgi:hypothetical protein
VQEERPQRFRLSLSPLAMSQKAAFLKEPARQGVWIIFASRPDSS